MTPAASGSAELFRIFTRITLALVLSWSSWRCSDDGTAADASAGDRSTDRPGLPLDLGTEAAFDAAARDAPAGDRTAGDGARIDARPDARLDSASAKPDTKPAAKIKVPTASQWTDHGTILSAGPTGAWDYYLWGGFAGTAVKKNQTFYLYYQGAKDYSTLYDTVTYRAIGVATSPDGKVFTKHAGNPVLKWFPTNSLEEGAVSAGALLSAAGEVVIYYGANTAISSTLVNGDGRVASSSDGLSFVDKGLVLDHKSGSLWGSGDELFPVLGALHQGQWSAYYIPNGTPQARQLGVAWGPSMTALTQSAAALSQGKPVSAWGMAGHAMLDAATAVLFISDVGQKSITAYTIAAKVPAALSAPLVTYSFPNMSQGTILLDADSSTWFLFYRNQDASSYGVRTAPVTYQ